MFPDHLEEVGIECSHGRRSHEEDDNLPSLDKLLSGVGEAQESHRAQTRDEGGIGGSDSTIEYPAQNDCNHSPIPGPKQCADNGGDTESNSLHLSSDDPTCEERIARHYSSSTLPIVANSEAGYDPWNPRPLILVLTDGAQLDVPFAARR